MFRSHPKFHSILAMLLVSLSMNVFSQTAPVGRWSGVVRFASSAVRLDAKFALENVRLHFEQPYSCHVDASFFDAENDGIHYRFTASSTGGFCDRLGPDDLVIAPSSTTKALISLKQDGNAWTGVLTPHQPAH